MPRQLQSRSAPFLPQLTPIPVDNGGTGQRTAEEAVAALGGIHASKLGVVGGVANLDTNGIIPNTVFLGGGTGPFGYTLDGPTALIYGATATYRITNYSSRDSDVPISISAGSVVQKDDTLIVTAPLEGTSVELLVGIRAITLPLRLSGSIAKPVIITPHPDDVYSGGGNFAAGSDLFASDPYVFGEWSTWFENIAEHYIAAPANAGCVEISGWAGENGVANIGHRNRDYDCGKSDTDRIVRFRTTPGFFINVQGTGKLRYRFLTSEYVHSSTDWQIASDPDFVNIVAESLNDTVNLLRWQFMGLINNVLTTLPNGEYYVRCRFNAALP